MLLLFTNTVPEGSMEYNSGPSTLYEEMRIEHPKGRKYQYNV